MNATRAALALPLVAAISAGAWWLARNDEHPPSEPRREASRAADARRSDVAPLEADAPGSVLSRDAAALPTPVRAPESSPKTESTGTRSIHGVVVDPAGAAIAGASVQAMEWEGAVDAATTTEVRGEFGLDRLPTSASLLHFAAQGRCAKIVSFGVPNGFFEVVKDPARIVLAPGVVAVARLRWADGAPCVGAVVQLTRWNNSDTFRGGPECGAWPAPKSDDEGRVVLTGLPPNRILGFGIELYGRNRDRPRPLETGHATAPEEAVEQCFIYSRAAKLTVVVHRFDAFTTKEKYADLRVERLDGDGTFNFISSPPSPCVIEKLVLGGTYSISLNVAGPRGIVLARSLRITELDQHADFDCVVPPEAEPSPVEPRFASSFVVCDRDGAPAKRAQLEESGLWPCTLRVRYGSLAAAHEGDAPGSIQAYLENRGENRVEARLTLRTKPPFWIEASLADLRTRAEVDREDPDGIELRFDLAQLATSMALVTFHARDDQGRERRLDSVTLANEATLETLFASASDGGSVSRNVPPGRWSCRGNCDEATTAIRAIDIGAVPMDVDLVVLDCGAIRGQIDPPPLALPDARRIDVSRAPVDGVRHRFDWWSGGVVAPDGSYDLRAVPPGDWVVIVQSTALDGSSVRIDTATATVRSNAVTRLDLSMRRASAARYRFELSTGTAALVHAVDASGRTAFDARIGPDCVYELASGVLRFRGAAELADDNRRWFDFSHWIDGVVAPADPASPDSVTVVRFAFPPR